MTLKVPSIRDVVQSANDTITDIEGNPLYTLLECTGEGIDPLLYPELAPLLESTFAPPTKYQNEDEPFYNDVAATMLTITTKSAYGSFANDYPHYWGAETGIKIPEIKKIRYVQATWQRSDSTLLVSTSAKDKWLIYDDAMNGVIETILTTPLDGRHNALMGAHNSTNIFSKMSNSEDILIFNETGTYLGVSFVPSVIFGTTDPVVDMTKINSGYAFLTKRAVDGFTRIWLMDTDLQLVATIVHDPELDVNERGDGAFGITHTLDGEGFSVNGRATTTNIGGFVYTYSGKSPVLPLLTPLDARVPYKVVGDLQ